MQKLSSFINKTKKSYKSLPDKKQYIEFFTAALTVPMLLTVIIINLNNLRSNNKTTQPVSTPAQERSIIVTYPSTTEKVVPLPSTGACKQGIGPISIEYPNENEVVTDNPVQIDINYEREDYCAVVWSYRINDGKFSGYDDKSIALYNPPQGTIRFQLKVKSIVTGEEKILTRTFIYNGFVDDSPTASNSAN